MSSAPAEEIVPSVAADPFHDVVGHRAVKRLLTRQLASGRLAHAYLLVGEPSLGKMTVARALSSALLPEAPLERHPDYWEDDHPGQIKVDEIRLIPQDRGPERHEQTLQAFLATKPRVGAYRVAVVGTVGRLPDAYQNLLLKTLEEPHSNRVIVLTTPSLSPFVVLPTVVSRCQRLSFHPVPLPEIVAWLRRRGVPEDRAQALAALSRGRPGWALRAARDEQVMERGRYWERRLEEVFGAPEDVPLALAAELDGARSEWRAVRRSGAASDPRPQENGEIATDPGGPEDPVQLALGCWQLLLRRKMLSDPGSPEGARWARLLELSYDTVGYLEQNVSPRLALECFLLACRNAS
ncbi:MAG TPA: hypothetical protein VFD01_20150 [Candidatus Dormibacteraeota bacterium]|nr:hypothetical protein [Candidatus Dormibacteraeota bacterium]